MAMNNIIPAWMLIDFMKHFNRMADGEITIREFYELILPLKEVPVPVKQRWAELSMDYTTYDEYFKGGYKDLENDK